jgi:uncharacterized protein (TIGR02996 family)
MREHDAFLRTVCEHPDEDGPRLVFADWLDEHGDPGRAELIRVQCELARLAEDDAARPALEERERQLLRAHRASWRRESPGWAEYIEFRRGFPAVVELSAADFLNRAAELRQMVPLEGVMLTDAKPWMGSLATSPTLTGLRSLGLEECDLDESDALALATSPYLTDLTALSLAGNPIGVRGARALAVCLWLARVERLDLSRTWIFGQGVEYLVESPYLRRIETLILSGVTRFGVGLSGLAWSEHLAGMKRLVLSDCQLSDANAENLVTTPRLTRLRELDLHGNPIGPPMQKRLRKRFGDAVRF